MDEPLLKRIMPHSTVAEQSVISSMLMDKDAIGIASDMLTKDDFIPASMESCFRQ